MVFAIPRQDIIYVGTTDTDYSANLENPTITKTDVQYLIDAVNKIAPTVKLELNDVKSAWSGLRPLIHEDGKDPSELSRKDEIFHSKTGLISIAGGKLTGYRIMAKDVVKIVAKRLFEKENRELLKCQTKKLRLSGGEFPFYHDMSNLINYADQKYDEYKQTGISINDFKRLFYRYGTNIDKVSEKAFDYYSEVRDTKLSWLKAELYYCVNYESIVTLSDFFIRRTGMIFFYIDEIYEILNVAADMLAEFLDWDEKTKQKNIEELNIELKRSVVFD